MKRFTKKKLTSYEDTGKRLNAHTSASPPESESNSDGMQGGREASVCFKTSRYLRTTWNNIDFADILSDAAPRQALGGCPTDSSGQKTPADIPRLPRTAMGGNQTRLVIGQKTIGQAYPIPRCLPLLLAKGK
ncbi:hypothetical protein BgiBS90_017597 [Biomphalaria glabrata]|nr:hypothetical protein BgiBS90_017597 [Biomphalaria glabrata]